jgi:ribosomal protein L37E
MRLSQANTDVLNDSCVGQARFEALETVDLSPDGCLQLVPAFGWGTSMGVHRHRPEALLKITETLEANRCGKASHRRLANLCAGCELNTRQEGTFGWVVHEIPCHPALGRGNPMAGEYHGHLRLQLARVIRSD